MQGTPNAKTIVKTEAGVSPGTTVGTPSPQTKPDAEDQRPSESFDSTTARANHRKVKKEMEAKRPRRKAKAFLLQT